MRLHQPDLLHRVIDASAERRPDAEAFRCDDAALTYADLADRSARVAGALREAGVRRGDRVALYLDKSLDSAVALFATMRAGAAYVPLDPTAPPERTRDVIRQCGARVAVSHRRKARAANAALGLTGLEAVIGLPEAPEGVGELISWDDALNAPAAPVALVDAAPHDLAYVIFTSGSTGRPKGIMHSHASGLAYARMSAERYGLREHDRLGNVSPLHFDMSTFDYFSAPLAGATTVILPDPVLKLPASLSALAEREALTIWYSVPFALIRLLLDGDLDRRDLSRIRWVLFGGEPFPPKHLAALMRRLPRAGFSNVYGPAETNQCTWYDLPRTWSEDDGQPPIGWPCAGAELRIEDEDGGEAAPGRPGELLVRSATMMRGYWKRPELNARVFARRPGVGGVEDAWLRTGDLVRRGEDGALHFLGRADRQVKTRGFRVELDEVEAALASHPAVEEAASWPCEHGEGLTLIEAAAVLRPEAATMPDVGRDIMRHASVRLPSYAAPSRFDVRAAFPRTTSGKIDRRALAEEAAARVAAERQGEENAP